MEMMQENARALAKRILDIGQFELVGEGEAAAAGRLPADRGQPYDEFDVASQLAAERGWMVPAYHLPPNADKVKLMRALVKLTLGYSLAEKLAEDMAGGLQDARGEGRRPPLRAQAGPPATGTPSYAKRAAR